MKSQATVSEYPLVTCEGHPGVSEPGYMACVHVSGAAGAAVAHVEAPTAERLGVICCAACLERCGDTDYVLANFILCCARCAFEYGLTPVVQ
jgi:hypothetical protein